MNPSPVPTPGAPVLAVSGIHKRFGGHEVLTDVSLQVHRGEAVCLLGPSGSGKSTLLRCINWLERPDRGRVLLNGDAIGVSDGGVVMSDRQLSALRTRIGMVFQHFALWPHMTVLDNVIAAPVQIQKRAADAVRVEALALLERVGLLHKKDAFPARLSGGQKQRVGIARALAMKPELLLFDEPTSALDPELVNEVLSVMRELRSENFTMVIVTHEMAFARDVASQIVFMDQGRVVESSPPAQFFVRPQTERALSFIQRFSVRGAATH